MLFVFFIFHLASNTLPLGRCCYHDNNDVNNDDKCDADHGDDVNDDGDDKCDDGRVANHIYIYIYLLFLFFVFVFPHDRS